MDKNEYQTMYQVEDRHWWYIGMQKITTNLISGIYQGRNDLAILDAGCGTGAAMKYMSQFGRVTGLDLFSVALQFCQQRGLRHLTQATVTQLPFVEGVFDLVTSFDVLCHRTIGDYRDALTDFYRVLKPGGYIFLRLPAYNWLRGHHDEVVYTVHRFHALEIQQALQTAGFTIEKISYANTLLFPLALGKRVSERFFPPDDSSSDVHPNSPWQDKLLAQFLFAEAGWLKRFGLPFGLTLIAIGRKA